MQFEAIELDDSFSDTTIDGVNYNEENSEEVSEPEQPKFQ